MHLSPLQNTSANASKTANQEERKGRTLPAVPVLQNKPVQKKELEEEEPLQGKFPMQLQASETSGDLLEKDEPVVQKKENNTGLPDTLKEGVENLSGIEMNDVRVHYNSDKPAQLQALAYAQGTDIHVGPGQEKHLPHEAWHVVQQKQGRVQPTMQMKGGVEVNDDKDLEDEANHTMDMINQSHTFQFPAQLMKELKGATVQRMMRSNQWSDEEYEKSDEEDEKSDEEDEKSDEISEWPAEFLEDIKNPFDKFDKESKNASIEKRNMNIEKEINNLKYEDIFSYGFEDKHIAQSDDESYAEQQAMARFVTQPRILKSTIIIMSDGSKNKLLEEVKDRNLRKNYKSGSEYITTFKVSSITVYNPKHKDYLNYPREIGSRFLQYKVKKNGNYFLINHLDTMKD